MIRETLSIIYLGVCSFCDIREKKIPVWLSIFFAVTGVIMHFIFMEHSAGELLLGVALGGAIMLISAVTGGQIGMGDGILFAALGVMLGAGNSLRLFVWALLLCFVTAGFLLVTKQVKRKDRLAFVPFVLCAYVLELILF